MFRRPPKFNPTHTLLPYSNLFRSNSVQISKTACAAKVLQINHVSLYRFLLSRPPSNDCWIVEYGFCGNKRHFPRRLGVKKGGFRPDSRVFASVEDRKSTRLNSSH